MNLSEINKLKLRRLGLVIIAWWLVALYVSVYEYLFLENFPGVKESPFLQDYGLVRSILAGMAGGTIGALLFGSMELFFLKKQFKNLPFGKMLLAKSFIYILILIGINFLGSFVYNSNAYQLSPTDPLVWEKVKEFLSSGGFINLCLLYGVIITFTIFFLQVSDRFGPGMLWRYFKGQYYRPREEERAFMFLDLKGSTEIAERLGHQRFYELLNSFYGVITDPIIDHKGEIYQYVGDEVVIYWEFKDLGMAIPCFFAIEEVVEENRAMFEEQFGLVPQFKAGAHVGLVTAGEIGEVKREIVYSGDVLNTAARIQGVCNQYGKRLLASQAMVEGSDLRETLKTEEVGEIQLRGKSQNVVLFAVEISSI